MTGNTIGDVGKSSGNSRTINDTPCVGKPSGCIAETHEVFIFTNSLFDPRETPIDWESLGPITALPVPKISNRAFEIRQHMGIIVIPSNVCLDHHRTLVEKLAVGMVYNHKGVYSILSASGPGRMLPRRGLRCIRALEHVGTTSKSTTELDVLCRAITPVPKGASIGYIRLIVEDIRTAQELLRVDRPARTLPRYRMVFWNCHDYALYFALLACDRLTGPGNLARLCITVKASKYIFCFQHEAFSMRLALLTLWVGLISCGLQLVGYTSSRILIWIISISIASSSLYLTVWRAQQIQAERDRRLWLGILETRFPKLAVLHQRDDRLSVSQGTSKSDSRVRTTRLVRSQQDLSLE